MGKSGEAPRSGRPEAIRCEIKHINDEIDIYIKDKCIKKFTPKFNSSICDMHDRDLNRFYDTIVFLSDLCEEITRTEEIY